jgi:hypothetical protein
MVAQSASVESQSSPRAHVSATTQTPPLHSRIVESAAAAHRRSPSSEQDSTESPPASPPLPAGAAPAPAAPPLLGAGARPRPRPPKLPEPPDDGCVFVQVLVSRQSASPQLGRAPQTSAALARPGNRIRDWIRWIMGALLRGREDPRCSLYRSPARAGCAESARTSIGRFPPRFR